MKHWQKAARDVLEAAFLILMLIVAFGFMAAGVSAVVYLFMRWIFCL